MKPSAFPWSKIIQTLDGASFEYDEQLYPFGPFQIPSRICIINFWNTFQFENSMNFKGVQTLLENLINLLKFYQDLILKKVNLDGHTYMQEIAVPIQV
jgi:hypothetical protein